MTQNEHPYDHRGEILGADQHGGGTTVTGDDDPLVVALDRSTNSENRSLTLRSDSLLMATMVPRR